jgi:mono/diheme cytochrome c family protein
MFKKIITHILFINALIVLAVVLFLQYAVVPVIPQSVFWFYVIALIAGLILFVTSTTKNLQEFWTPIEILLTNDKLVVLRWLVMLAIPAVVAFYTGLSLIPSNQAPLELRVVHPAPPGEISFDGKTISMREVVNPFRKYEENDPEKFAEHVELGRKVYYENCHFCHGDFLDGKGPFANALDPKPANFQDVGTIAQLQESYVFWRIAKGGPGLPNESMPWQTAMPAWGGILSENDIWDVTLFLYKATNHHPRTWE